MSKNKIFRKNNIFEYVATIIISLLIVVSLCVVVELELMFRCEDLVNFQELNTENLSKFYTIEELEKQLKQNPDDQIINIQLGEMYDSLNMLEKANEHFKVAMKVSNHSNLAIYSYATFCARHDMYMIAATLAEELPNNSRKANYLKAKIYEQIGDSFSEKKNYLASTKAYQIVYKYAKSLRAIKYFTSIKEKLSLEYIKLADYHIESEESLEAVSDLNNSIKINDNPVANYKLGLIYLPSDKRKAEKYMYKAFEQDVYVVNPYIYNSLVNNLIQEAQVKSERSFLNLYTLRMNRFKKRLEDVCIYRNQLLIDNSMLIARKSFLKKVKYFLAFDIKNNTHKDFTNLYLRADLYINNNKFQLEKKIFTPTNQLQAHGFIQDYMLEIPYHNDLKDIKIHNDIFVKYFAKKTKNSPWVLIKIDFLNI